MTKSKATWRRPLQPDGKRRMGNLTREERQQRDEWNARHNPPRQKKMMQAPMAATASPSSTSTDSSEDLANALRELERDPNGGASSAPGPVSTGEPGSAPLPDAPPLLTGPELVEIAQGATAAAVALFAIFTGRKLPDEQVLEFSAATRKMLEATSNATAAQLQDYASEVRMLSPAVFYSTTLAHTWRKVQEVRAEEPKQAPREVEEEPRSVAPPSADAPPENPRRITIPSIPPPQNGSL